MPTEQRFTFDDVATSYDATRPGYPEALFDQLGLQGFLSAGARAVEIGCGTGQATRPLAERGVSVVALEPGQQLADLAAKNLSSFREVEIRVETFEEAILDEGAFDLLFAAQSFHWIPPEIAFSKAQKILRVGGALAIVGNAVLREASPIADDIDAAYAACAPNVSGPAITRWYSAEGPVEDLLVAADGFDPPHVHRFPWRQRYTAAAYCDLLVTHSDHQLLPPSQLSELLARISAVVEAHGGSIEIQYEANLYVTTRAA